MSSKNSNSVSRASAGGEAKSKSKRSQVTGRQLGKFDLRAARKNAECIGDYMSVIDTVSSSEAFTEQTGALSSIIARVVRGFGAGRFEVAIVDGTFEKVHVAGSVSLRGRAATKTDRDNCMCVGDYILVRAGLAAAKLPMSDVERIHDFYDKQHISYPKHFFGSEEDGDDLFDYSGSRDANDGSGPTADDDEEEEDDDNDSIDISMI
jgi:hypothetical protein